MIRIKPKSRSTKRRSVIFAVAATSLLGLAALTATPTWAQQSQPTKPFAVELDVQLCEGGQFRTGAPCEGETRPGESSDILLLIKQEEGAPLLTGGYLRSTGFKVTPGMEGVNNDKVGEGNVKIGVAGIGTVGLLACVVNQNPPDPGDTATLIVVLNISSTVPCDPGPALAKVKLRIKSIGENEYEYTLDLAAAAAAAGGAGGGSLQLMTPLDISLTFFGVSQPNEDVSSPTPGGVATIRFVDEPGSYQFLSHFEGPTGAVSEKQIPFDVINPQPPKKSTNFVPIIVIVVVLAVLAVIAYVAWSRRRAAGFAEDWEYYEEDVYYEEDEYV